MTATTFNSAFNALDVTDFLTSIFEAQSNALKNTEAFYEVRLINYKPFISNAQINDALDVFHAANINCKLTVNRVSVKATENHSNVYELSEFIESIAATGATIFYSPALRDAAGKSLDSYAVHYIDIDEKPGGIKLDTFEAASEWYASIKKSLAKRTGCVPGCVFTGHGLHFYWLREDAVEREVWLRDQKKLMALPEFINTKVDSNVATDSERILRIPTTTNAKVEASPVLVQLLNNLDASYIETETLNALKAAERVAKPRLASVFVSDGIACEHSLDDIGITEVATVLRKYHADGHRNNNVYHFAGYAANQSLIYASTEAVLDVVLADDEEASQRMVVAHKAYERLECGEPVAGWSKLNQSFYTVGAALGFEGMDIDDDLRVIEKFCQNPENRRQACVQMETKEEIAAKAAPVFAELSPKDQRIMLESQLETFKGTDFFDIPEQFVTDLVAAASIVVDTLIPKVAEVFSLKVTVIKRFLKENKARLKAQATNTQSCDISADELFSDVDSLAEMHPAVDYSSKADIFGFGFHRRYRTIDKEVKGTFHVMSSPTGNILSRNEIIDATEIGAKRAIGFHDFGEYPDVDANWSIKEIKNFVDTSEDSTRLLSKLITTLKDFVELPSEENYMIVAAWIMLTYVYPLFSAVPYLFFHGEKESGKSQLLGAMKELCYNAERVAKVTAPALAELIGGYRCTCLIDQTESIGDQKNANEELVSILAGSYESGGGDRVVVQINKDNTREPYRRDTFGPKTFASWKNIARDIRDRCIIIQTAKSDRSDFKLRDEHMDVFMSLRNDLFCFALKRWKRVQHEFQIQTLNVTGRPAQIWGPLSAILHTFNVEESIITKCEGSIMQTAAMYSAGIDEQKVLIFVCLLRYLKSLPKDDKGRYGTFADLAKHRFFNTAEDVPTIGRSTSWISNKLNELHLISDSKRVGTKTGFRFTRDLLEKKARIAFKSIITISDIEEDYKSFINSGSVN